MDIVKNAPLENTIIDLKVNNYENKRNSVDMLMILRAFACFLVIIQHSFGFLPKEAWTNVLNIGHSHLTWLIFSPAWVGVWIFFILSGYLMGKGFYTHRYPASKKGSVNFWINRAIRICPLYYFSIFIVMLFISPELLKIQNISTLFKLLTFTYNGEVPGFANGALWSISTEVQYYLCVPFLFIFLSPLLRSRKIIYSSIFLIIVTGFISRFLLWKSFYSPDINYWAKWAPIIYKPFIINLDFFLTGFLLNALLTIKKAKFDLNNKVRAIKFRKYLAIFLMIALYFISAYVSFCGMMKNRHPYIEQFVFACPLLTIITTAFYIYTFEVNNFVKKERNQKFTFAAIKENPLRAMEVFGILTYGLYLWHSPILMKMGIVYNNSIPIVNFLIKFTIAVVFGTVLAGITYLAIEKPLEKLKKFNSNN